MSEDLTPRAALRRLRMQMDSDEPSRKRRCYNPRDSSLTFVDGEDELDFLCEEFESPKAVMSCGHAVTPMSLTKWCIQLLEDGQNTFVCAVFGCDAVWPFEEVCKMAQLTTQEIKYFKKTMAINASNTRRCPGCMSHVARQNKLNLCVGCKVCTAKKGRQYEFCWQCLREWKGPKPRMSRCENEGCSNTVLQTLQTCPDIVFDTVIGITGCPSIRACPTCGSLLEHKRNHCKHLTCPQCKVKFCFVCLKTFAECSRTSGISAPCSSGVAPRQTVIPVWRKS
ncbi:PREDICTED: probable E3 ubiquitin-protein ligase ARI8 isoform X2 [Cyprinodon variegatus]|uniref:probable E3 ubiquitin-protein ligase ARI8 isoform X2 n=1 Tax=Cyprinodon variegatus TaxID=28743 RepID=UPI00074295C4|nr:PREDICTED: probable E3 ubiquitin-protein ligase ARI8 isoform X2 [Cyprinodon variegatus]